MTSKTNHEMNRKKQLDNRAASKNKQSTTHRTTWTKPKTADVGAVNGDEKTVEISESKLEESEVTPKRN